MMRRAGTVVRVAQGLAIVQAADADHPDIGTTVLDESLADVGRIVDVFGPVERPYLAVSPAAEAPALLGEPLYVR